jgi:hypothetical protein
MFPQGVNHYSASFHVPGFAAVTTESLLTNRIPVRHPRHRIRSPYDIIDGDDPLNPLPFSPNDIISVENYDPRSSVRTFNDEFTLQALQNLKIRPCDLYFPATEDLLRIAGDTFLYRDRLIDRALRLAQTVQTERKRLILETFSSGKPGLQSAQSDLSTYLSGLSKKKPEPAICEKCAPKISIVPHGYKRPIQAPPIYRSPRPRIRGFNQMPNKIHPGETTKSQIFKANPLTVQSRKLRC